MVPKEFIRFAVIQERFFKLAMILESLVVAPMSQCRGERECDEESHCESQYESWLVFGALTLAPLEVWERKECKGV